MNILKEKGIFAFICSNKFIKTQYGEKLRELILNNQFTIYDDLTGHKVFKEAQVDTCVIQIKKSFDEQNQIYVNNTFFIEQSSLNSNSFTFKHPKIFKLREKILNGSTLIKDLDIEINRGILTGLNEVFIIDEKLKNDLIKQDSKNKNLIVPILRGRDITKWKIWDKNLYLIHSINGINLEKEYPALYKYFLKFEESLKKRGDKGKFWYNLRPCKYDSDFIKEKIVYSTISTEPCFIYDNQGYYLNNSAYFMISNSLNLKYLNSLLTSDLLFWYFKDIGTDYGGKAHPYRKIYIEQLPIKLTTPELENEITDLVDTMIKSNKELITHINNFHSILKEKYRINKLSKKLENYYELSLDEFFVEIKKSKVNIKNKNINESLLSDYEINIGLINKKQDEINNLDSKINRIIYGIYNLTEDEINLIENQIN